MTTTSRQDIRAALEQARERMEREVYEPPKRPWFVCSPEMKAALEKEGLLPIPGLDVIATKRCEVGSLP